MEGRYLRDKQRGLRVVVRFVIFIDREEKKVVKEIKEDSEVGGKLGKFESKERSKYLEGRIELNIVERLSKMRKKKLFFNLIGREVVDFLLRQLGKIKERTSDAEMELECVDSV